MFRFFRKKREVFNVQTIDFTSIEKCATVLDNLISNNVDGYVVKNVFSVEDLTSLKAFYKNIDPKYISQASFLNSFPESVHTAIYSSNRAEVGIEKELLQQVFGLIEGMDIESRIKETISFLAGDSKVQDFVLNNNRVLSPFQIRGNNKLHYGILPHCEKMFYQSQEYISSGLDVPFNSIPYFILINKAVGGEICLYDLKWRNNQSITWDDQKGYVVNDENSNHPVVLKDVRKQIVKIEEGDLFIFNGQDIWHSVTPVTNEETRITIGGFIHRTSSGKCQPWN